MRNRFLMIPFGMVLGAALAAGVSVTPLHAAEYSTAAAATSTAAAQKESSDASASTAEASKSDTQESGTAASTAKISTTDSSNQSAAGASTAIGTVQDSDADSTSSVDNGAAGKAMGLNAYEFVSAGKTAWLTADSVLRSAPYSDGTALEKLEKYSEVYITGVNNKTYWRVEYYGQVGYVKQDLLESDEDVIAQLQTEDLEKADAAEKAKVAKIRAAARKVSEQAQSLAETSEKAQEAREEAARKAEEEARKAEEEAKKKEAAEQTKSSSWNGPVLSRSAGTVTGPNGKETYYNLNMSGVVSIMHSAGYGGEYWVRNDGCKMLGDYIMVAANLSVHPRGSLVETSLGTGIVADTGGFASHNPTQIDIATNW